MWTKRYLTKPTKEEFFKTKHPIATSSILVPCVLYYLFCLIKGINSPWMIAGFAGCLILGTGLAYGFAVIMKIYKKVLLPVLCLISGGTLIVLSLFLGLAMH